MGESWGEADMAASLHSREGDMQAQAARFPPTQTSVGDKVQEGTAEGQPQDKSPWASSCVHCSVLVVLSTVGKEELLLSG